ncbi:hypothetical protein [Rickettsia endosymbiont of Halotydeus destructor]
MLCDKYNLKLLSINALDYGEDIVSDEQVKKITIIMLCFIT